MNLKAKFLRLSCVFLTLFLSLSAVQAQNYSFGSDIDFEGRGAVYDENESIKGYYFYTVPEKVKRKDEHKMIHLTFLDQNLKVLFEKAIKVDARALVIGCRYSGQSLALKTINIKEKNFKVYRIDATGNKLPTKTLSMSKAELGAIQSNGVGYSFLGGAGNEFVPVVNKGYLAYGTTSESTASKLRYQVTFISDEEGNQGWKAKSKLKSDIKGSEIASYLGVHESTVFSGVYDYSNMKARSVNQFVVAHDLNTGDQKFKVEFSSTDKKVNIFAMYEAGGMVHLTGEFYDIDDKMMSKSSPKGICTFKIDDTGKIVDSSYLAWQDFSKYMDVSDKGSVKGEGSLFFHEFIPTASGDVYAVAEVYNKQISGKKLAGNILMGAIGAASGGAVNGVGSGESTSIFIKDLYMMRLSSEGKLLDVKKYEKDQYEATINFYSLDLVNEQLAGRMIKQQGGFGFVKADVNTDRSKFWVGYSKYNSVVGKRQVLKYESLAYEGGDVTKSEIEIDSDAKIKQVYPAKPGYIMVYEYFKKEKNTSLRLVRLEQ